MSTVIMQPVTLFIVIMQTLLMWGFIQHNSALSLHGWAANTFCAQFFGPRPLNFDLSTFLHTYSVLVSMVALSGGGSQLQMSDNLLPETSWRPKSCPNFSHALHSFWAALQSLKYWLLCSLWHCGWWPTTIKELPTSLQLSMHNLIHLPPSGFWHWHQLPWQQGMSLHRDGLLQLDMPSAVECSIEKNI